MVSKGADALSKDIANPRQAAFFDIGEDVSLRLLSPFA